MHLHVALLGQADSSRDDTTVRAVQGQTCPAGPAPSSGTTAIVTGGSLLDEIHTWCFAWHSENPRWAGSGSPALGNGLGVTVSATPQPGARFGVDAPAQV